MDYLTVKLLEDANVCVLEDSEMRINWFKKQIPKNLTICRNVEQFKTYFSTHPPCDFVFWDHDLGPGGNGADAAKWFLAEFGGTNRAHLIHSFNIAGARNIQNYVTLARHIPFGEFGIEFV